jgi:hypothetical protein
MPHGFGIHFTPAVARGPGTAWDDEPLFTAVLMAALFEAETADPLRTLAPEFLPFAIALGATAPNARAPRQINVISLLFMVCSSLAF